MIHNLKIEKKYLDRLLTGSKTFEIRKNDRDFQVGDEIEFREIFPESIEDPLYCQNYPRYRRAVITYVLHFPEGLRDGYVAFSLRFIDETKAENSIRQEKKWES